MIYPASTVCASTQEQTPLDLRYKKGLLYAGKENLQFTAVESMALHGGERTDHLNEKILYLPMISVPRQKN